MHEKCEQRHPVLVVTNSDGFFEVYAAKNIDVCVVSRPHTESQAGERLADRYLDATLPQRHREIFEPINLRWQGICETVMASDLADQAWTLEVYAILDDLSEERTETWVA